MPTVSEINQRVNDVSESHASLYAAFESHRTHCATDKSDMKGELRAINGKLWAGLILLVMNLLAFSAYLVAEGTPWEPKTVLADRGE
jgi:hypothetical protein